MIRRFFSLNLDFAGAATAALCAVHCTLFPVLLSFGIISSNHHNHYFDWVLMSIGLLIAGFILVKDFTTNHRNILPLTIAGVGFITLFVGIETHGEQFHLNVIGGLLIVGSHILNWRMTHSRKPCLEDSI
jgi:membrane-bound metal-dependent hydrolase YbcI (DUF457 family)